MVRGLGFCVSLALAVVACAPAAATTQVNRADTTIATPIAASTDAPTAPPTPVRTAPPTPVPTATAVPTQPAPVKTLAPTVPATARPAATTSAPIRTTVPAARTNCDPAYPTVCIPPAPPDLDCRDIPFKRFVVRAPDPHRFDADKDGIGCE